MERYDYIIVGAGSAGCVLAARLSASGRDRVLLLEAGPSDLRPWIQIPLGYGRCFHDPRINWCFHSEPEPGLGGRSIYVPRGKVLGGSSSINAMIYVRGQPEDYAAWAKAGNPSWDWPDVLAAFRALEDHSLGGSEFHGADGPLRVEDMSPVIHPVARAFYAAGAELGLPYNPDFNGARQEGVGPYQITAKHGRRMSAARAFLRPAMRRANLRVLTGALATGVRLDGKRATGVTFTHNGATREAAAGRDVILSAGAINSPQLLQLSGIGPGAVLQSAGIEVRHQLPSVGENLQDHMNWDRAYRTKVRTLNDELFPFTGKARAALRYALFRAGPLAASVNNAGAFVDTSGGGRPDVQVYFCPITFETMKAGKRLVTQADPFSGISLSASPCRPSSRGRVSVRSADPLVAPAIHVGGLTTDEDVATMLAGARLLDRLARSGAMSEIVSQEIRPGPIESEDALIEDIRARAYSIFHPCGTCRMGPDPRADVVDAQLRVHGIANLRVIDASIFPAITSGNINAPSIMTGWRGADLVIGGSG